MARSKASKDMVQAPEDEDATKEQEERKEEAGKSGEDPEEDVSHAISDDDEVKPWGCFIELCVKLRMTLQMI